MENMALRINMNESFTVGNRNDYENVYLPSFGCQEDGFGRVAFYSRSDSNILLASVSLPANCNSWEFFDGNKVVIFRGEDQLGKINFAVDLMGDRNSRTVMCHSRSSESVDLCDIIRFTKPVDPSLKDLLFSQEEFTRIARMGIDPWDEKSRAFGENSLRLNLSESFEKPTGLCDKEMGFSSSGKLVDKPFKRVTFYEDPKSTELLAVINLPNDCVEYHYSDGNRVIFFRNSDYSHVYAANLAERTMQECTSGMPTVDNAIVSMYNGFNNLLHSENSYNSLVRSGDVPYTKLPK